jgi:hypothetical protein
MQGDSLLDNCQPETGAAHVTDVGRTLKGLEKSCYIRFRNADP